MTTDSADYSTFVATKLSHAPPIGMADVPDLPDCLFPFQKPLVRIALQRGRCALFEETGLGKTIQELAWADQVRRYTGKPVLILTPLAVAGQMVKMAECFGFDARRVREGAEVDGPGIYVTNYDRLHLFNMSVFGGVACDESSILKDYTSSTRNALTKECAGIPFRLSASATPAPNSWTELGCHAEFLGIRTREEMLSEFFVHDGGSTQDWRLKRHAVQPFWEWVASWALVVRKPSDLGFDNGSFDLPPLHVHERIVELGQEFANKAGMLFVDSTSVKTLSEQRGVRRLSVADRVNAAAALVAAEPDESWIIWGELNDETDLAEKKIPGAVQVAGKDSEEDKESRLLAFAGGREKVLVTKSKIAGAGLNLQCCARQIFLGATHSFEAYYQSVRRSWRYGQGREVHIYVIATDADRSIIDNLKRKQRDAAEMNDEASQFMVKLTREACAATVNERTDYVPTMKMTIPKWLVSRKAAA